MIILVRNNGIIHSSFLENELRIHEYSELKCTDTCCAFLSRFTQWSLAIVSRFQENGT